MMLLSDLASVLEANQVAERGNNLFLGTRPEDGPEEILTLHEYPGLGPEYQNDGQPGPKRERPQVQVMGRGKDYELVRALVQGAWVALSRVTNRTINGVWYQEVRPSSSPALIGRDGNDRVLIGFNASVVKEV